MEGIGDKDGVGRTRRWRVFWRRKRVIEGLGTKEGSGECIRKWSEKDKEIDEMEEENKKRLRGRDGIERK